MVGPEVPVESDELNISLPAVLTPKTPPHGFFKEPSSKSAIGSASPSLLAQMHSAWFAAPTNAETDASPALSSVRGVADTFQKGMSSHREGQPSMEETKRKKKEAAETKEMEKEDAEYQLAHPELFLEPLLAPVNDKEDQPMTDGSVPSTSSLMDQLKDENNA